MKVTSKVPVAFHAENLLIYLATRFSYLPESSWSQLINEGRILCNGSSCHGVTIVAQGDSIQCDLPDFDPPAVNLDYSIVYQDEWLLAINKPAGLRVHSRGKFVNANLIYQLRHVHQPPFPEANLVHRLDADTSGLVLLARDKAVLANLAQQFAAGAVEKRYLAVVKGHPAPAEGSIYLAIGAVKDARVPRYAIDRLKGKAALTHYKTLRQLSAAYSLVELRPQTGRTHQLRIHLAAIGHPIAGDALYSMTDAEYLAYKRNPPPPTGLERQALHSQQLQFLHPVHQTCCTLSAPLASDIEGFIEQVSAAE